MTKAYEDFLGYRSNLLAVKLACKSLRHLDLDRRTNVREGEELEGG